ncbi:LpxI family protein [Persephonella sp.]
MSKVGVIAGSGELPIEFAKSAKKKNTPVEIFAIKNITDKNIEKYGKTHWLYFGEAQKLIDTLKDRNIKKLVMLGKIEHHSLIFSFYKLDKRAREFFSKLKDKRAKSILEAVIQELEKEGFEFIDPSPYLSRLLIEEGIIGSIEPDENQIKDALLGLKIAKEIAELDIGQTVVVKDGIVIAVEGIEGTDRCITRGGELGGEGTTVCKVARKNQDMRYDVPVIGTKTLKSMKKAKAKLLAVEAGKTFLLEREKFKELADKYGIAVVGFKI